jgi:sarcosine oxidase subunit alpha
MHHIHVANGASMEERDGWHSVVRYSSADEEIERATGGVGLADFSQAGKLLVQGEDVDSLVRAAYGARGKLDVGTVWRRELKGYGGDETMAAARLAHDEVLALMSPGQSGSVLSFLEEKAGRCAHVVDLTSTLCSVRATGPYAEQLLSRVTELDLRPEEFGDMSCAQGKVAELQSVVLRHDIGGLRSYELYFGRDYGQYMWESLTEAGHDLGIAPYGVEALERLVNES